MKTTIITTLNAYDHKNNTSFVINISCKGVWSWWKIIIAHREIQMVMLRKIIKIKTNNWKINNTYEYIITKPITKKNI